MPGVLSVEPGCQRVPEFVWVFDMVEKEHDFRIAGAVDGCNALSDALIELGLLSGSGVWARFLSDCDSPGALSEQNRVNEGLPRHIVVVIELVLLQAEDVLFCHFF